MVSETDVATAALAIAISALVIAAGQLIAQLFSTADGYRRCQPSIIGDWYKLVERKFRWSSFRYEVKVTTPHFEIQRMTAYEQRKYFLCDQKKPLPEFPWSLFKRKSQNLVPPHFQAPLLGLGAMVDLSKAGTAEQKAYKHTDGAGDDVPTWITLLDDIHRRQLNFPVALWNYNSRPICITRKTRSWDFMPPDIVRPVSSTTVGCLITMAHRLGMTWSDFRLDEGKMHASGSGRSFSTSIVRGMGLVVEYSGSSVDRMLSVATDKVNPQATGAEAPNTTLDFSQCATKTCPIAKSAYEHQMTRGIIPAGRYVHSQDLQLRNVRSRTGLDIEQPFSVLRINGDTKVALEASLSHRDPAHRVPAFTDVMGLWCDWIPVEGFELKIDNPFPFPLTTMGERPESRNVWRSELRKQESSLSDARKEVLRFYDNWEVMDPQAFVDNYRLETTSDFEYRFFKQAFHTTTAYLDVNVKASQANFASSVYTLLISVHISTNARSVEQAEENVKNNVARETDSLPDNLDPIFKERAYIYAENVPKFVEDMERSEIHDSEKNISYEDMWWILMMRLHAWTMSVNWDDDIGVKIPREYYYSPVRVYIL